MELIDPLILTLPERLELQSVKELRNRLVDAPQSAAVVLKGGGTQFCLGMDFVVISQARTVDRVALRHALDGFAALMQTLLTCARPTLAVVDGPAYGGGLGLAAACDFVLATERSTFSLPEALYGLSPSIIQPALKTRLTDQQLNKLLFTCHSRSAHEALAMNLVDQIVASDQLEKAMYGLVRQFRRARNETVAAARSWNAAKISIDLQRGVEMTNAALTSDAVIASLFAALGDEDVPWQT